jgi:Uri superfamily endonuclease
MKGVYILILRMDKDADIRIGKLGELHFKKGFYAYIGSAHGTGGFKRVTRHFSVASGKNSTRKWHIDYLLPHSKVVCAVLSPINCSLECVVAKKLEKFSGIPDFGCSDCSCQTHLLFSDKDIKKEIIDACYKLTGNESIIIYP